MKRPVSSLALALGMLAGASAFAATTTSRSATKGIGESPGTAIPTIIIDDVAMTTSPGMAFSGLLATAGAPHPHCCVGDPLSGAAAVAVPLNDVPFGSMAGTYAHDYNLADASTYSASFMSAYGGTASELSLTIHTPNYAGGEMRGVLAAAPVPESAAWLMLGAALAGLGMCARRTFGATGH